MSVSIPLEVSDVNSQWLTDALHQAGHLPEAELVDIISIRPLSEGAAFTTKMYRVELSGQGLPTSMILKLGITTPVRQVVDGVGAYQREAAFYKKFSDLIPVRIPKPFVAEFDAKTKDMVILIEDLAPLAPADQLKGLSLTQAQTVMKSLAEFHAWSWRHERLSKVESDFMPIDSPAGKAVITMFGQFFEQSWPVVLQTQDVTINEETRNLGLRLPTLLSFFTQSFSEPRTIVHGELRSDNFFFDQDQSLILIDFQTVMQATGMLDVSYLVSQSLPVELRRQHDESLIKLYWQSLIDHGVTGYSWEQAWQQYRLGLAYSLIFPGMAFMGYDEADDHGKSLLLEMLHRASEAIVDHEVIALLPQ